MDGRHKRKFLKNTLVARVRCPEGKFKPVSDGHGYENMLAVYSPNLKSQNAISSCHLNCAFKFGTHS
jgi:hypothetical protein